MKKRGRSDDKSGIRDERLRIFRTMIGPLLDYYGEEMVSEIDGTQSRSEIATEIAQLLGE
jgi:adenylate kinase family enzyme